jgi:hypothetical protein
MSRRSTRSTSPIEAVIAQRDAISAAIEAALVGSADPTEQVSPGAVQAARATRARLRGQRSAVLETSSRLLRTMGMVEQCKTGIADVDSQLGTTRAALTSAEADAQTHRDRVCRDLAQRAAATARQRIVALEAERAALAGHDGVPAVTGRDLGMTVAVHQPSGLAGAEADLRRCREAFDRSVAEARQAIATVATSGPTPVGETGVAR